MKNVPLLGFVRRKVPKLALTSQPEGAGTPIFVLVHGTYAQDASWTQDGSLMVSALRAGFDRPGLACFTWHSFNGLRARLRAAFTLAGDLDRLSLAHPGSPIVAIAHSHGGNVVAWASTLLCRPIHGAVYMNTPFLWLTPRPWSSDADGVWVVRMLMGMAVMAGPGAAAYWWSLSASRSETWAQMAAGSAGLLALFALRGPIMRFTLELSNSLTTLRQVTTATRHVSHEAVAAPAGDEVGSGMGLTHLLGEFAHRWGGRLTLVSVVLLILVLWLAEAPQFWVVPAVMAPFLLAGLAMWGSNVFGIFAYGLEQGLLGVETAIATTSVLAGDVHVLPRSQAAPSRRGGPLTHSSTYQDPVTVEAIVAWAQSTLGVAPSQGSREGSFNDDASGG
jgi:hypothetical protein